ncbi:MAG: LytTR family DNA-binding domain-containing protein [Gemmatimonadaceae bacterium]
MKVSVLIADDEPVARAGLRDMLAEVEWVTVVGEAANGLQAVEAINTLAPELVFLDIQMPGLLGTEVLTRLSHQPFVVFTTAFAQHAVAGFELGALDYPLKPFGHERLAKCLDRVRAAIGEPHAVPALGRLGDALGKGPMTRLFVRAGTGIVPVAVEDVGWFESSGDYVTAHVGRSRYMLHLALSRLEARLAPGTFTRIHRTHIVNLAHVASFRRKDGKLVAEMRDGAVLPVSRERAREIRGLGL